MTAIKSRLSLLCQQCWNPLRVWLLPLTHSVCWFAVRFTSACVRTHFQSVVFSCTLSVCDPLSDCPILHITFGASAIVLEHVHWNSMMRKNKHRHTRKCSRYYFVKGGDRYCRITLPRQRNWMCIFFFVNDLLIVLSMPMYFKHFHLTYFIQIVVEHRLSAYFFC